MMARIWLAVVMLFAVINLCCCPSRAETITREQLVSLLPDEQDMQTFTRTSPVGEFGQDEVFQNGNWVHLPKPAMTILDQIEADVDLSQRHASIEKELPRLGRDIIVN